MTGLVILILVMLGATWFFAPPSLARVLVSRDEINRCAQRIALREDYKGDVASFLVDGGNQDILGISDAYHKSIGLDTVYTTWARKGARECLRLKLIGRAIPPKITEAELPKGYHITRWNGSAQLVKDGDPEPVFGCMDGYHPTGTGCVRNQQRLLP